ncbi:MAG: hypothetical protein ACP5ID_02390, partial [Conexivisphaera sp.]
RSYKFLVILKPKESWADEIYLGNMLVEALGQVSSMTGAFDFEVIEQKEGDEGVEPTRSRSLGTGRREPGSGPNFIST